MQTAVYYVEISPFCHDPLLVLTEEEYWTTELSPYASYQHVFIPFDFASEQAFRTWISEQNQRTMD